MAKQPTKAELVRRAETMPALYDPEAMKRIQENLAGETVGLGDLTMVKVPGGGGQSWEIEGEDDTREITGYIIHTRMVRAYWKQSFEEAPGQSPDCMSQDGIEGHGDPGGDCASCPLAQFGSDSRGSGQACKLNRLFYLVRPEEGDIMPLAIRVSPGSLKSARTFIVKQIGMKRYWSAPVTLTLEQTTNRQGIKYSRIKFRTGEQVDEDLAEKLGVYAEYMAPLLQNQTVELEQDDFGETE